MTIDGERARARLAIDTWESLFRTQVAVMRRLAADDIWHDVSLREYDVLYSLTQGPPEGMRLRDLNRLVLLSQPSLSRMIDRLERRGLVSRSVPPEDARGTLVALTDAGRAAQRRVGRKHAVTITECMLPGMTDAELGTLGDLLGKLRAAQA